MTNNNAKACLGRSGEWRVSANDAPRPALVRTTVALSLAAWFGVGLAGRIIGFI